MTINATHRKHYKSGACLSHAPLQFAHLPDVKPKRRPVGASTAVLTRPAYFQPKTSRFSRFVGWLGHVLTGGRLAAA